MEKVTARDIEAARRAYAESLGTEHEAHYRSLLWMLVEKAREQS